MVQNQEQPVGKITFSILIGSSSNLVVNSLSLYFQVNNYPFLLTFIRKYRH